eukprot:TRINITY_DN3876_c0_g1_i1.p1 TRINITY_DN3876_c0_g1~~TRINITY_DN3876_c0_g1_i1.p1  ORF type:complete len:600 (+),score=136.25 TRINITY_DN3876_c0_g1_i1:41-1840(+)
MGGPPLLLLSPSFSHSIQIGSVGAVESLQQRPGRMVNLCVSVVNETTCGVIAGLDVQCLPAYDHNGPYAVPIEWGHLGTFVLLVVISLINFTKVNLAQGGWLSNLQRITMSLYCLITGFFALFRWIFELSKPLAIGATIHNYGELITLMQIYWNTDKLDDSKNTTLNNNAYFRDLKKQWVGYLGLYTALIVMLEFAMPTAMESLGAGQVTGLPLDFIMFLTFLRLSFKNVTSDSNPNKNIFLPPLFCTTIHLTGTILPLVLANFFVFQNSWFTIANEMVIFLTAIVTHSIYINFSVEFDKEFNSFHSADDKYRLRNIYKRKLLPLNWLSYGTFAVSFAIAVFCLFGPARLLGLCKSSTFFIGTSVGHTYPGFGDAFETAMEEFQLAQHAKAAPGNIDYVILKNTRKDDEYRFIESWDNEESLLSWMASYPQKVFRDRRVIDTLVGGKLDIQGLYSKLPEEFPAGESRSGGVSVEVGAVCKDVWKVIGDWNNCQWVVDCRHADLSKGDPAIRTLFIGESKEVKQKQLEVDDEDHLLKYQTLDFPFEGMIRLIPPTTQGEGCLILHKFTVPTKEAEDLLFAEFYNVRAPFLKKVFAKQTKQ